MPKFNDIERQAGTLMLSNLKMFNEAVVTFEQYIEHEVFILLRNTLEKFVKSVAIFDEIFSPFVAESE